MAHGWVGGMSCDLFTSTWHVYMCDMTRGLAHSYVVVLVTCSYVNSLVCIFVA